MEPPVGVTEFLLFWSWSSVHHSRLFNDITVVVMKVFWHSRNRWEETQDASFWAGRMSDHKMGVEWTLIRRFVGWARRRCGCLLMLLPTSGPSGPQWLGPLSLTSRQNDNGVLAQPWPLKSRRISGETGWWIAHGPARSAQRGGSGLTPMCKSWTLSSSTLSHWNQTSLYNLSSIFPHLLYTW